MRPQPCPFVHKLLDKREWKTQEPAAVDSKKEMGARPKHEASFKLENDLVDLLKTLDLLHLSQLFVVNQVTMKDLQKLEAKDLQEIGINKLMDRKLILDAAKQELVKPPVKRDTNIVPTVQKASLTTKST